MWLFGHLNLKLKLAPNNMDEDFKEYLFIFSLIIGMLIIGVGVGVGIGHKAEQQEAIKVGAAYYTNNVDGESVFKYHSANK